MGEAAGVTAGWVGDGLGCETDDGDGCAVGECVEDGEAFGSGVQVGMDVGVVPAGAGKPGMGSVC